MMNFSPPIIFLVPLCQSTVSDRTDMTHKRTVMFFSFLVLSFSHKQRRRSVVQEGEGGKMNDFHGSTPQMKVNELKR